MKTAPLRDGLSFELVGFLAAVATALARADVPVSVLPS